MIIKYLSLILTLFSLGCGSTDSKSAPKPTPTELLVPLYSEPTDKQNAIGNIWDAVAEASSGTPLTVIFGVIREDGAPVGTPNSNYTLGLKKLREGNASILAYVETTNGSRDIEDVKTDVLAYANHFDIDGIFFDEVNGDMQFTDYYNKITNYAKSFDSVKKVMLNSSGVQKDFIQQSTADDFLVFENYYEYWDEFNSTEYVGLDYEKLHIILHTIPDADTMRTVIQEANQKNITNLYITNRDFSHLPTFWDEEVSFIKERNALLK